MGTSRRGWDPPARAGWSRCRCRARSGHGASGWVSRRDLNAPAGRSVAPGPPGPAPHDLGKTGLLGVPAVLRHPLLAQELQHHALHLGHLVLARVSSASVTRLGLRCLGPNRAVALGCPPRPPHCRTGQVLATLGSPSAALAVVLARAGRPWLSSWALPSTAFAVVSGRCRRRPWLCLGRRRRPRCRFARRDAPSPSALPGEHPDGGGADGGEGQVGREGPAHVEALDGAATEPAKAPAAVDAGRPSLHR